MTHSVVQIKGVQVTFPCRLTLSKVMSYSTRYTVHRLHSCTALTELIELLLCRL